MASDTVCTKDDFYKYIALNEPERSNNIYAAMSSVDKFAVSSKAVPCSFFDDISRNTLEILKNKVVKNKFFTVRYKKIMCYVELGMNLLAEYIDSVSDNSNCSNIQQKRVRLLTDTNNSDDDISAQCNLILKNNFEDGYRIGNYMHRMRFYSYYEEAYGKEFPESITEIDSFLRSIGQVRDDRIFPKGDEETDSLLAEIYSETETTFDKGASAIYLECLYKRYSARLVSEMNIYSADSFRTVLQNDHNFPLGYKIERAYITKFNSDSDVNSEIKNMLQSSPVPLTYSDINKKIWYIPIEKIKAALQQIPEAVNVDANTYYFAPDFYISSEERSALINAMHSAVYSKGYIASKELRNIFRKSCPSAALDSEGFKDYGIREILKVLLCDHFDFSSSVITEKGTSLDLGQVYQNFAAEHERLSLDEIKEFQRELGAGTIYWNSIFKEMVRISSTELVCKDMIHFDTDATDNALDMIYTNEYTALKSINLFLSLPSFEYRWNGFVLESFLRDYSKKFRLVQLSISNDDYYGVMLRNTSKLCGYDDVAADMLAKNNSWYDERTALKCLVDAKFQQRAANKNIPSIIKLAKQKRENL